MDRMPESGPSGPGIRSWEEQPPMAERADFRNEITLSRDEVLDVVASCDEVVVHAEAIGEVGVAFAVDAVRKLLLGRLMGEPGGLND